MLSHDQKKVRNRFINQNLQSTKIVNIKDLSKDHLRVICFIGESTIFHGDKDIDMKIMFRDDQEVYVAEIKNGLGIHQEKLGKILEELIILGLIKKDKLLKFFYEIGKKGRANYERDHNCKIHTSNKKYCWLTQKGIKLYRHIV